MTVSPERISYTKKRPQEQPRVSLENSRERHEDMVLDGPQLRRKKMQAESARLKDSVHLRNGLGKIFDMLKHGAGNDCIKHPIIERDAIGIWDAPQEMVPLTYHDIGPIGLESQLSQLAHN